MYTQSTRSDIGLFLNDGFANPTKWGRVDCHDRMKKTLINIRPIEVTSGNRNTGHKGVIRQNAPHHTLILYFQNPLLSCDLLMMNSWQIPLSVPHEQKTMRF